MRADDSAHRMPLWRRILPRMTWRKWVCLSVVLLLLLGSLLGMRTYQRHTQLRLLSTYLHSFQFTRDAVRLAQATHWPVIPAASQVATSDGDESPEATIQFKFYDALRHTAVKVASTTATHTLPSQAPGHPSSPAINTHSGSSHPVPVPITPHQVPVVTAQSLAEEMAAELQPPHHASQVYVVQVGVFQQAEAAQKLRHQLAARGYAVAIVERTKLDKLLYCVRVGPYNSKQQATAMLKELQQHGFQGLVYTH